MRHFGGRQHGPLVPTLQKLGHDANPLEQLAVFAAPTGVLPEIRQKMRAALKEARASLDFVSAAGKLSMYLPLDVGR